MTAPPADDEAVPPDDARGRPVDGSPADDRLAPPDDGGEALEVPETAIEIQAHFHFGMTGSFPLRLGDLFFADDGLYVVEYGYITPFFGLTGRKHRREAAGMRSLVDRHGIDAALLVADSVVWHGYDDVERVVVHDGGWLGRPKLAVYPATGPSHAYRFHDRVAFEDGLVALDAVADEHDVDVDERSGLGFAPRESLERFFWKP